MLFINKLFNSIACLLSFTNLQLVIPGRTWILLYSGRTVYKRLWACLALYWSSGNGIKMLGVLMPLRQNIRRHVGIVEEGLNCQFLGDLYHFLPIIQSSLRTVGKKHSMQLSLCVPSFPLE